MISLFKDTAGLTSFFIILGVGFAAVSVYDFVFDRLHRTPASPDRTSPGQG
jgi:hypothetical protein